MEPTRKLRSDEVLQDGKIVRARKPKPKDKSLEPTKTKTEELIDQFKVDRQPTDDKRFGRIENFVPKVRPNRLAEVIGEDECLEDSIKKDPSLGVKVAAKRGVRQVNMVDVVCSKCGLKETVAAILAISYSTAKDDNSYKCNTCSTVTHR